MNEDKLSKSLGIIITLLVHILLALLLWLFNFGTMDHEDESGIMVMVGVDAEGSGSELEQSDVTDLQPEPSPDDVPPTPPSPESAPQPSVNEPLLAQDDTDAPYADAQKEEELKKQQEEEARQQALAEAKRKAEEEAARKKAEEEAAKRKAISNQMAGLFNNNGTGSSSGAQGAANGNSTTGATSGSAGYGEFDLGGRGMIGSLPRPAFDKNTSGKVVVFITVDAAGVVKSATIGQGTTISDQQIRNAAKEAALRARFKAVSGNSLTPGKITYYFDSNN